MKKWVGKEREKILILLLAGVLLLVVAIPTDSTTKQEEPVIQTEGMKVYGTESKEELLEKKLEEILRTVNGIGEVKVMITLKSDGRKMVEKDERTSSSGSVTGTENGVLQENFEEDTVFQRDSSGNEIPYVAETAEPEVAGVIVAAQGADHGAVAAEIMEAVMALFGTDAHKIKVMKMK